MDFELRSILKRSVTIELQSGSIFYSEPYSLLLNGEELLRDRRNVVTLQGLEPETEYSLSLCQGGECVTKRFITRRESVLLNVRDFGAHGDGVTEDTAFLQAAIAACPENGTVYLPEGTYLSRPLFLKSNMSLWLEKGAVLLGDADRAHYPMLPGLVKTTDGKGEYSFSSWEGEPYTSYASLLTGIEAENVEIFGEGTVDGNAAASDWWQNAKVKRGAWRPNTIFLCRCRNVCLQGITVRNSPSWTIHPYYTDQISLFNVEIWNPSDSPNTDGFDPESCADVLVLGCKISVGDDCIAIKSGKLYMSTHHHKTAERITVRNSLLERGHGAVTVGSEAAGGVVGTEVSQCIFEGTDRGLRIKTRRGRGPETVYDRIHFHDLIMRDVHMPFTLNMFYFCDPDGHSDYVQRQDSLPVDERTPLIGSVVAEDIECTGADGCILCAYGLPERYIENIELRRIRAAFRPRAERSPRQIIMMDNFPEMTGKSVYARNIKRLLLSDISIHGSDDEEPEIREVIEYDSKSVIFHE